MQEKTGPWLCALVAVASGLAGCSSSSARLPECRGRAVPINTAALAPRTVRESTPIGSPSSMNGALAHGR